MTRPSGAGSCLWSCSRSGAKRPDPTTNKVVYEFIEGRKVDLNNKGKQLYDKYRQKPSTQ
ncbi:MAG: hypothetical protein E4G91_03210 [Candidatus Zixiibacteriota bacterium]|nr:MAG: hypothetical protein E4G91_03210 [candidate division Zixibacteria bacterium]